MYQEIKHIKSKTDEDKIVVSPEWTGIHSENVRSVSKNIMKRRSIFDTNIVEIANIVED